MNDMENWLPSAFDIKSLAEKGLDNEMIAAELDMLEPEFTKILKSNKDLRRALTIGKIKAKSHIHSKLWNPDKNDNVGLLLLQARMHLNLSDPVLDEQAGDFFKKILSKTDNKTRENLLNLFKLKLNHD